MIRRSLTTVVLVSAFLAAQAQDEHIAEARGYLAQDACEEAVAAAGRSLLLAPSAEAYWIIGHCHLERYELDSARLDLEQAIALDSAYSEAEFDLGLTYQYMDDATSAIGHYRRYSALMPDKLKGRVQEAYVTMEMLGRLEEAQVLLDACAAKDPANAAVQYYMAVCAKRRGELPVAMEWIAKGERDHPDDPDFPMLTARWAQDDERWSEAADGWGAVYRIDDAPRYAQRQGFCRAMANTDSADWTWSESERVRFTRLGGQEMQRMDAMLVEEGGRYELQRLLRLFADSFEVLSLDQFFMCYYGQHLLPSYAPYGDPMERTLPALLREKEYAKAKEEAEAHMLEHPVCLEALRGRAIACMHLDDPAFLGAIGRYEAVMQSIEASGSGASAKDAIVVSSVHDEYILLDYNDLSMRQQALIADGGHSFDRMDCVNQDDEEVTVFFDITKPFGSLGKMFEGLDTGPGKKKKNRKK